MKVPCNLKWEHLGRVLDSPLGRSVAVNVMRHLLEDLDRDGRGLCYPSIDRLVERSGCSRRSVIEALSRLEEHGFVIRQGGGGRGQTSRYRFPYIEARMRELGTETVQPAAPKEAETVQLAAPVHGQNGVAERAKRVQPPAPKTLKDKNPNSPPLSPPRCQQSEKLLPIERGRRNLVTLVAQGFVISRDRAEPLVDAWLEETTPDRLRSILARAQANGVTRDDLPTRVRRELNRTPESSAGKTEPAPTSPAHSTTDERLQRVLKRLSTEIGKAQMSWFRDIELAEIRNGTARLTVPKQFEAGHIGSNYADVLRALFRAEVSGVHTVEIRSQAAQAA